MPQTQISVILADIERGNIGLPNFQRQYVWRRRQIREFFQSLYKGYPIGGVLFWKTRPELSIMRNQGVTTDGTVQLIVDGQQRITTLYAVIKGEPPVFFAGDRSPFDELHFHVEKEEFGFFRNSPGEDSLWINVFDIFKASGVADFFDRFADFDNTIKNLYTNRILQLIQIQNRHIAAEEISEEFDLRTVVDIFDKVNKNGTPLNPVDLAISFISLQHPKVRDDLQGLLANIRDNRYWFDERWALRCVNAVVHSRYQFDSLYDISSDAFQYGLRRVRQHMRALLNQIQTHLGLDHNEALFGKPAFIIMVKYLEYCGGLQHRDGEMAQMLYWYINSAFWGRYRAASASYIQQDLNALEQAKGSWEQQLANLNQNLQHQHGQMILWKEQFLASTRRANTYSLLYMLTRATNAPDFCEGVPLGAHRLDHQLHLHHLFPRAYLRRNGVTSIRQVHSVANYSFLLGDCNIRIQDRPPEDYFPEYEERHPGVLSKHWIPDDPQLWRVDRYYDFLVARSELLRDATNEMLAKLKRGKLP